MGQGPVFKPSMVSVVATWVTIATSPDSSTCPAPKAFRNSLPASLAAPASSTQPITILIPKRARASSASPPPAKRLHVRSPWANEAVPLHIPPRSRLDVTESPTPPVRRSPSGARSPQSSGSQAAFTSGPSATDATSDILESFSVARQRTESVESERFVSAEVEEASTDGDSRDLSRRDNNDMVSGEDKGRLWRHDTGPFPRDDHDLFSTDDADGNLLTEEDGASWPQPLSVVQSIHDCSHQKGMGVNPPVQDHHPGEELARDLPLDDEWLSVKEEAEKDAPAQHHGASVNSPETDCLKADECDDFEVDMADDGCEKFSEADIAEYYDGDIDELDVAANRELQTSGPKAIETTEEVGAAVQHRASDIPDHRQTSRRDTKQHRDYFEHDGQDSPLRLPPLSPSPCALGWDSGLERDVALAMNINLERRVGKLVEENGRLSARLAVLEAATPLPLTGQLSTPRTDTPTATAESFPPSAQQSTASAATPLTHGASRSSSLSPPSNDVAFPPLDLGVGVYERREWSPAPESSVRNEPPSSDLCLSSLGPQPPRPSMWHKSASSHEKRECIAKHMRLANMDASWINIDTLLYAASAISDGHSTVRATCEYEANGDPIAEPIDPAIYEKLLAEVNELRLAKDAAGQQLAEMSSQLAEASTARENQTTLLGELRLINEHLNASAEEQARHHKSLRSENTRNLTAAQDLRKQLEAEQDAGKVTRRELDRQERLSKQHKGKAERLDTELKSLQARVTRSASDSVDKLNEARALLSQKDQRIQAMADEIKRLHLVADEADRANEQQCERMANDARRAKEILEAEIGGMRERTFANKESGQHSSTMQQHPSSLDGTPTGTALRARKRPWSFSGNTSCTVSVRPQHELPPRPRPAFSPRLPSPQSLSLVPSQSLQAHAPQSTEACQIPQLPLTPKPAPVVPTKTRSPPPPPRGPPPILPSEPAPGRIEPDTVLPADESISLAAHYVKKSIASECSSHLTEQARAKPQATRIPTLPNIGSPQSDSADPGEIVQGHFVRRDDSWQPFASSNRRYLPAYAHGVNTVETGANQRLHSPNDAVSSSRELTQSSMTSLRFGSMDEPALTDQGRSKSPIRRSPSPVHRYSPSRPIFDDDHCPRVPAAHRGLPPQSFTNGDRSKDSDGRQDGHRWHGHRRPDLGRSRQRQRSQQSGSGSARDGWRGDRRRVDDGQNRGRSRDESAWSEAVRDRRNSDIVSHGDERGLRYGDERGMRDGSWLAGLQ